MQSKLIKALESWRVIHHLSSPMLVNYVNQIFLLASRILALIISPRFHLLSPFILFEFLKENREKPLVLESLIRPQIYLMRTLALWVKILSINFCNLGPDQPTIAKWVTQWSYWCRVLGWRCTYQYPLGKKVNNGLRERHTHQAASESSKVIRLRHSVKAPQEKPTSHCY